MHKNTSKKFADIKIYLCIFLWIIGLMLGVFFGLFSNSLIDISSYDLTSGQTSFFSRFAVVFFPFSVCAYALVTPRFYLIYPLFFIIGVCRGFSGMFLVNILGSGAWVVRLAMFFSASLVTAVLWWLLLKYRTNRNTFSFRDLYIAIAIIFIISVFDFSVISPLIADII